MYQSSEEEGSVKSPEYPSHAPGRGNENLFRVPPFPLNLYIPSPPPNPSRSSAAAMDKLKAASCFSCCFRRTDADASAQAPTASLVRSSTDWVRARAQDFPDRCRGLVSRITRPSHHRRHSSADFGYDPLSYALNFDDGPDYDDDDADPSLEEVRFRNFSSRLPASPPQAPA